MTNRKAFHRSLLRWYANHGRDLPWRRTRDPYAVLVSEFMLQQTQVATVRAYYIDWLKRWPTFTALARAPEQDVLRAWEGLGYYSRARNLHATAKLVQDRHRGALSPVIADLRTLPGVGKYTAHAVASFAFNRPVPIVEANTTRVLARLFNLRTPIDSAAGQRRLWRHAANLVPKRASAVFHSALLDLGALVCLPRKPRCTICPVQRFCRAKTPAALPIRRPRPPAQQLIENHSFILNQNRILLEPAARRWRNLWILPPLELDRLNRSSLPQPLYEAVFGFTHHRVMLRVFRERAGKIDNAGRRWFAIRELESIPIPSPHRRAIVALLDRER